MGLEYKVECLPRLPFEPFAYDSQGESSPKSYNEEYGDKCLEHLAYFARDTMAQLDVDGPPDHLNFRECELGGNLVGGDAQRIEATRQVARFEHDDVVPQPAQAQASPAGPEPITATRFPVECLPKEPDAPVCAASQANR